MAFETHVWKLTGITPLVQNNPAETLTSGADTELTAGKKVYDDAEEARIRTYVTEDGQYYHPSAAIRAALLAASTGRKISKRSAKSVLAGSVFPMEQEMLLKDEKGKSLKKYEIYKCRVKVGTAGVLRCRPRWRKWTIELPIEIDTAFVTTDIVTEMLTIAGRIIGIGDERPDTTKGKNGIGTCGRFTAELKV
jgi:hypothetical protein